MSKYEKPTAEHRRHAEGVPWACGDNVPSWMVGLSWGQFIPFILMGCSPGLCTEPESSCWMWYVNAQVHGIIFLCLTLTGLSGGHQNILYTVPVLRCSELEFSAMTISRPVYTCCSGSSRTSIPTPRFPVLHHWEHQWLQCLQFQGVRCSPFQLEDDLSQWKQDKHLQNLGNV